MIFGGRNIDVYIIIYMYSTYVRAKHIRAEKPDSNNTSIELNRKIIP